MKNLFTITFLFCLITAAVNAGGSWIVDGEVVQILEVQTTNDDPAALHTDGSRNMQAPLKFDAALSTPTAGLVKAYFPPDGTHIDFFIIDEDEEVFWLASSHNVSYGVGDLVMNSSGIVSLQNGTRISFEEHNLSGGWLIDSVMNDPYAIMNRNYADNRYILKSAGITTTHTVQAGDVLQIQNGIITAINP